ncbi:MAG: AAA family ATPase [Candidatus Rifleibacteriota bacterium]
MKIGLTLGKYSPLHQGHQLVIETALREMDRVYVLVYESRETTRIPLKKRADWVRRLYPQVTVIEGHDSPTDVGYTPEVISIQDNYIRSRAANFGITHFYSSEPYGDHVSKALNAVNRQVDIDRNLIPISGTEIRKNPLQASRFIAREVYSDLITNVVFVGAPSTGKTSIAQFLAADMNTVWMPEYGKEYWEKNQKNHRLDLNQLVEIARGHLEREKDVILRARDFLFSDTNVLTTRIFSYYYHGSAADELERLADEHAGRYDLWFLCDTDIPYEDTWDRSGAASRDVMQKMIVEDLESRQIPFQVLRGSIQQRADQVKSLIFSHKKFPDLT